VGGEETDDPADAVREQQPDPVAGADAAGAQAVREPSGPGGDLGIGRAAVRGDDEFAVRVRRGDRRQHLGRGVPSQIPVGEHAASLANQHSR
jgi:hypothetical protein